MMRMVLATVCCRAEVWSQCNVFMYDQWKVSLYPKSKKKRINTILGPKFPLHFLLWSIFFRIFNKFSSGWLYLMFYTTAI